MRACVRACVGVWVWVCGCVGVCVCVRVCLSLSLSLSISHSLSLPLSLSVMGARVGRQAAGGDGHVYACVHACICVYKRQVN